MLGSAYEIERKWLIDGFPPCQPETVSEMEQAYLAFWPATVRLRKCSGPAGQSFVLCVKSGEGLKRRETELPLTEAQYAALAAHLPHPPVKKQHKTYRLPTGHLLECNLVDEGEATSFYYAEVEFGTEEEALAFAPPGFLGRELTGEEGWSMGAYCRRKYHLDADGNKMME